MSFSEHKPEASSWLRVPIGSGSETWSTIGQTHTLLAIAHSVTALTRLMDALTVLNGDLRIQVLFTPIPASAFDDGVIEFLKKSGARIVPWEQAKHTRFDLAISASHSGDLHKISAPLILLPHGLGYNKYLRSEIRDQRSEIRDQRSEIRDQRSEIRDQRSMAWPHNSCSTKGVSSLPRSSFHMTSNFGGWSDHVLWPCPSLG